LKYAWRDGFGVWHTETVDAAGQTGLYTSLALDAAGYPHISYNRDQSYYFNNHLKYAYKDGSGWHTEVVDAGDWVGTFTSIALDASGHPHISYTETYVGLLKYAREDCSGWHIYILDWVEDWGEGGYTSLALDTNGYPHISYMGEDRTLKHAYTDGAGWQLETVDGPYEIQGYTSLALDGGGYPHISYRDWANDDLMYAYKNLSGWHTGRVDSLEVVGEYSSLFLDASDNPHISYYDGTFSDLKYARGVTPQIPLSGSFQGGELVLSWTAFPGASAHWVYGADSQAYFEPELVSPYQYRLQVLGSGATTWSSSNGIGDPDHNWTYQVIAVGATEQELCRSNRYGEHDFDAARGP
jgi:hypothetical protein